MSGRSRAAPWWGPRSLPGRGAECRATAGFPMAAPGYELHWTMDAHLRAAYLLTRWREALERMTDNPSPIPGAQR